MFKRVYFMSSCGLFFVFWILVRSRREIKDGESILRSFWLWGFVNLRDELSWKISFDVIFLDVMKMGVVFENSL